MLPRETDGEQPRTLVPQQATGSIHHAAVSPGERWLAYESTRSGRSEIYVRAFQEEQSEWPITTEGGCCPVWARDGFELYYWRDSDDGTVSIAAVPVGSGTPATWGRHGVVVRGAFAKPSWDRQYDVATDGRFLLLKTILPPPPMKSSSSRTGSRS